MIRFLGKRKHDPVPITVLDPDTSQFTTLLMRMPKGSSRSAPGWNDWGDWSWTEYAPEAREALFAFERKQSLRESPKVSWLEDEFMPLMGQKWLVDA